MARKRGGGMTCKDCIHYELCNIRGLTYNENLDNPVENVCEHFKDESKCIGLPCKVGDMVYYIPGYVVSPHLLVGTVTEIMIGADDYGIKIWQTPYNGYFLGKKYGITWFTTKKEAKAKLKEIENGN